MAVKSVYKEGESLYLLEYEQKKIRDCARTLNHLAKALEQGEKSDEEEPAEEEGRTDRKNLILKSQWKETRILMADHLKEVARIVTKTTEEEVRMIRLGERRERKIAKMMLAEGILLTDLFFVQKEGEKKEVVARFSQTLSSRKKKNISVKEVAELLSIFLDLRLQTSHRNPIFVSDREEAYYFEEEPKYMILTGFAKAVKEDENISGDNFSFLETEQKEFVCVLSDGMGSGNKAYEESEEVIDKIECLLESGFEKEKAIQMMNDTFLIEGEERNMSTLDMCSIDLYSGKAEFFKVGAAYSLIKRDGYVEKIPSFSLPLGLFSGMEIRRQEKILLEGDYVLLFSDGVLDYYEKQEGEEILKELLANVPYRNPSQIASYLMKHTLSKSQGKIGDDMTILVMGMWENKGGD